MQQRGAGHKLTAFQFLSSITEQSNTSSGEGLVRITTKGQVTIPVEIRERFGLLPETEVEFTVEGDKVILMKARRRPRRGQRLVEHLRGRGTVPLSTDEILALTRAS